MPSFRKTEMFRASIAKIGMKSNEKPKKAKREPHLEEKNTEETIPMAVVVMKHVVEVTTESAIENANIIIESMKKFSSNK